MNLNEHIKYVLLEESNTEKNLLGKRLRLCSTNPMTGYFRDGLCKTNSEDQGTHTVCATVTRDFLKFTKSKGNDLSTPTDSFEGLKPGNKWCLCAKRWKEAYDAGVAPKVDKRATNLKTIDIIGKSIYDNSDMKSINESEDLKKPFMKYEKLINRLVYEVFDEGICGFSWETFELFKREGTSLRIILHFTYDSVKEFGYEKYAKKKEELKDWILDFLPKFRGIFIAYDTTKCKGTHKEEETEGVGGYAAPAFEMEPDHVHFKHLYNESQIPLQIRRRVNKIDKLVDIMLSDMYVNDYDNEEHFFDGLIFELGWLVRNEDFGLHDVEWSDIYDYIDQYRRDDINEYYREHQNDEMNESELKERCWKGYTQKGMKTMFGKRYPNCVKIKKKKTIKESIRNILLQEINKKYSKPTEKVDKLVYKWLDDYFKGSQIYKHESWKHWSFRFEFCKNGREIADLHLDFDDRSPDWGPRDKRPTSERSFKNAWLYIYPVMINELLTDIPIRKNYLLYLIEEWFEDTKLNEIQQGFNRSDMSLEYVYVSETKKKGELCVPPVSKPEDVTMQEMMDYIKKTTLYSYEDIEKNEEEEPGWIEELYLAKLQGKERERLNQEDRENNPEPFNDNY